MIYEKFFVINHGHRHDPHTNRPGLPGCLAVVVVGLRRSCPTKMASVWNLVWKVYWLINVSYQCIANNFCLLIEYPSFFKSTLPYLSEFLGLSLPSLWNISHVAWPYVSLHSPILCHDISHYTIIVSHRSALFRIVFSITAQLDRALAGMTTTGGYRNYICLALPYVIWYCFSGPIYEIWACLSLLFEHTYVSSILSYINLFHLIRPIPIASCTNIPVAVGLLLVGWPPSHTGEYDSTLPSKSSTPKILRYSQIPSRTCTWQGAAARRPVSMLTMLWFIPLRVGWRPSGQTSPSNEPFKK